MDPKGGISETAPAVDRSDEPGFPAARLSLARIRLADDRSLQSSIENACRISALALGVARVSVWAFDPDGDSIRCLHVHGTPGSGARPDVLHTRDYPTYFGALRERRWIFAEDARVDPLTRELSERYLLPFGIVAMLDAPVFRGGEMVGIVCHEHLGERRVWSANDRAFAGSVADVIGALLEQGQRLAIEAELRREHELAQQGEKMAALVRLAAGIAHDLNGFLSMIRLQTELLERDASADEHATESIVRIARSIRDGVDVGLKLGRQLMDFATPRQSVLGPLDVGGWLRGFEPLLRATVEPRCRLEVRTPEGHVAATADRTQLEQVLLNLTLNARDASPDGGRIEIALEDLDPSDAYVDLRVTDFGSGMSTQDFARLFEPFFSTKGDAGHGLGLANVYSMVHQMGGRVTADSRPGHGSTFRVHLRVSEGDPLPRT